MNDLSVCVRVCVCVCVQGFDPELLARLPEWQFDTTRLRVCPATAVGRQPQALRNALTQLHTHLATPTPIIELSEWGITPDFVSTVATALPADSALRLGVDVGVFFGGSGSLQQRQQLQQMGPRVCSVAAGKLAAGGVLRWPWASLFLGQATISMLAQLLSAPLPADGGLRTVYTGLLSGELLSQVSSCMAALRARHPLIACFALSLLSPHMRTDARMAESMHHQCCHHITSHHISVVIACQYVAV